MELTFNKFILPAYETIRQENQKYIDNKEYKGYQCKVHVCENLYLLIDCQNESFVVPNGQDIIRFAWSTCNEFAIASSRYVNTEAGYIAGCTDMINSAHLFAKAFAAFVEKNLKPMRKAIKTYEATHPNEEETV